MRHFLEITDLTPAELTALLDRAARLKATPRSVAPKPLANKVLTLVFEKPSLRTRASFETAAVHLGGASLFFAGDEVGLGTRESLEDVARTLSQYADGIVLRTFKHATATTMARHATVPVINGLSDRAHPCQALADLLTIREAFGDVAGKKVVFVGDGNNVARSLALGCRMLGATFVLVGPTRYHFEAGFATQTDDVTAAVKDADVVYTDVWTSMGQEAERAARLKEFAPYQVNAALLGRAPSHAKVLHCLPAHRGEEITAEVLDGPQCLAFPQAANRLHAQKALLAQLLE